MNRSIVHLALPLLLAAAAIDVAPAARAQGTGTARPMPIVVTFTPGGAPDILARPDRRPAERELEPAGADRQQAPAQAATSAPTSSPPPDGLTIVVGTVGTHAMDGSLYAKMP
jgi:hypothetical protein